MKVWVTRDTQNHFQREGDVVVWQHGKKPEEQGGDGFDVPSGSIKYEESAKVFKSLFGFTPCKGSCKKYELTLKEIK